MKLLAFCSTLMVLAVIAGCATRQPTASTAPHSPAETFFAAKLAEMDDAIQGTIREGRIPGGVLWLERNGESYHKAYGSRSLEPAVEVMTENTIFDAASLTKVIAGTPAILLLIERRRVSLDAPVHTYIPEFVGEGREAITVRQLLTHTSGLRPDLDTRPAWSGYDTAMRMIYAEKLVSPPGTVFRYSDINFELVGEIVHRVSGESLNRFVEREVYLPLKMKETRFLPGAGLTSRIAPTERTEGKMLRGVVHDPTARYMGGVAGHAGLFTTAADLARFARMMLNEGSLDGVRVFKPETVRLMTAVQTAPSIPARRGLGWDIDSGYSRPRGKHFPLGSYGHTGFTGTSIWIDPFSKTFWIFLSNRVHPDGKGNVLPLQARLADLAAEAVIGFNFSFVPGSLPARTNISVTTPAPGPAYRKVLNGIDVLKRDQFSALRGLRVGLVTNHTGQDRERNATIDLLFKADGVRLIALFSPEHGIRGLLDEKVPDSSDEKTGLPVFSLYGERRTPLPEQLKSLDALVFDLQDIGCRFYTYISTMGNCMEAATKAGIRFIVLDRVNPINGTQIEGPLLDGATSFVGYHTLPVRHGMTTGELAQLFRAEKFPQCKLTVIPVEGWSRSFHYDQTGLPWTNPSPNMRSLDAAILYPGIGLLESAISVGRGTDTPFEIIGAPYIDDLAFSDELNRLNLPGLRFIPVRFTPKASTFKDKPCGGARILVLNRDVCNSVDLGLAIASILQRIHPKDFALDKMRPLLLNPAFLAAIQNGAPLADLRTKVAADAEAFRIRREPHLLYK